MHKRGVNLTIACTVTIVLLSGCQSKNSEVSTTESQQGAYNRPIDDYNPDVLDVQPVSQSDPAMDATSDQPFGSDAWPTEEARVHVVAPKETLYSIARQYYNDHRQWKKIYEANQDQIADPNRIRVGMKLVIP